jgi:AcrR family transcriptional regulator
LSRAQADTRGRLLDAAAHVMRTLGFARTTTKEIARASGYSEATIYKHFPDKTALFLAVLRERLPSFVTFVRELDDADDRPVRDRVAGLARAAIAFYLESFPVSASIFAEPTLLAAHRAALAGRAGGPRYPLTALTDYLRREQRRGRIRAEADCAGAAALLLGACFQYAFLCCFEQRQPAADEIGAYAASVTGTLLAGIVAADPVTLPGRRFTGPWLHWDSVVFCAEAVPTMP